MDASTVTGSALVVPMPRLSDSMEEGVIVRWLVADGETVKRGQEIVEIETDKATMAFEAPAEGPIWIVAADEAVVAVGDPIARIGAGAEAGPEAPAVPPASEEVAEAAESRPAAEPEASSAEVRISPVARRLARDRGVDLVTVVGSGPGGRILKQDILAAASGAPIPAPASGADQAPQTGARGGSRRQEPSRSQAIVARRMAEARATVPEFPVSIEVAMGSVIELRRQLKTVLDPAPTLNDFITVAVARTLPANPRLNAGYIDGGFEFFEDVNLGIAVAADDELLVPVIRGADRLSLEDLAAESRRLVERTRSGAITPPDLAGSTFSLSNLGMFGISSFQPIVNPPQAAILGVGGISPAVGERPPTMSLTLVSDHRIVYGAHAARFLAQLRDLLESPIALLTRK
jgi:pyruvate dehydrogenase E2 component (dihydrolipoamide acetyltransferase)